MKNKKARALAAAIMTALFVGTSVIPAAAAANAECKHCPIHCPTVNPHNPLIPVNPNNNNNNNNSDINTSITAEERQMVDLVNKERISRGLKALQIDVKLMKTAKMKSKDMVDYKYFSHTSPRFGSPFDMMKANGISFGNAAENIAGNGSVESAHKGLMNSSGHRSNILSPNFKKIGIGIIKGGPYGMMFTQQFTD